MGDRILSIQSHSFFLCYNLTLINIENVIYFGEKSFYATCLTSIANKTLEKLENNVFPCCDSLQQIEFANVREIISNTFSRSDMLHLVRFPCLPLKEWENLDVSKVENTDPLEQKIISISHDTHESWEPKYPRTDFQEFEYLFASQIPKSELLDKLKTADFVFERHIYYAKIFTKPKENLIIRGLVLLKA